MTTPIDTSRGATIGHLAAFEEPDQEPVDNRWKRQDEAEVTALQKAEEAGGGGYFAPKAKGVTVHPRGIMVSGDWWTPNNGCAYATRRNIIALERFGGLPVQVPPCPMPDMDLEERNPVAYAEVSHLRTTVFKEQIARIIYSVPHANMGHLLYPGGMANYDSAMLEALERAHRRTICFIWLERDRLSEQEADMLRKCGQVWVTCQANVEALVRSGIDREKARIVPHPFDTANPLLSVRKVPPPEGTPYAFYAIGKWEPRKGHRELLHAFMMAFRPGEQVVLYLKTHEFGPKWSDYPSLRESVVSVLATPTAKANGWTAQNAANHIAVHTDAKTDAEMMRYHMLGQCYVSASHGEGWDLPGFDAYMAGSHLIQVCRTGHEAYDPWFDGTDPKQDEMVPVHPGYGWPKDALWEHVDVTDLAVRMREAFKHRLVGQPARGEDGQWKGRLDGMTYEAVGKLMRKYVDECVEAAERGSES